MYSLRLRNRAVLINDIVILECNDLPESNIFPALHCSAGDSSSWPAIACMATQGHGCSGECWNDLRSVEIGELAFVHMAAPVATVIASSNSTSLLSHLFEASECCT